MHIHIHKRFHMHTSVIYFSFISVQFSSCSLEDIRMSNDAYVCVAFLNTYSWFYVKKNIDSNNEIIVRTDWPAWTDIEPELNQLEPEEPTRAFSWRLDGCSEAIKSSRESSGHGNSSGFNSNKCLIQHILSLTCKPKSESLINK